MGGRGGIAADSVGLLDNADRLTHMTFVTMMSSIFKIMRTHLQQHAKEALGGGEQAVNMRQ